MNELSRIPHTNYRVSYLIYVQLVTFTVEEFKSVSMTEKFHYVSVVPMF